MKQAFKAVNFRQKSLTLIQVCNGIIREYQELNLRLTLRQVYYQLVSRNVIQNTQRAYKSLGGLLSEARLAGLVDWDAIEDRGRLPSAMADWPDIKSALEAAEKRFRFPRWEGQDNYVELWVEKSALANVLWPLAAKYHVTMMVNRGYSSQSAMYESAQRFLERAGTRDPVLFYLGDHDPSGEDMVRDIYDRLVMFGVHDVDVQKLALTMEQVRQYDPPPNPAKMTDSRAAKYVEEHGADSWEVDALNPKTLAEIIETAFQSVTDMDKMNAVIAKEKKERKHLVAALPKLVKVIAKAVEADNDEPEPTDGDEE